MKQVPKRHVWVGFIMYYWPVPFIIGLMFWMAEMATR